MFYLFVVLIPLLIASFVVQQYVEYMFHKWGKTTNSAQLSGMKVADRISRDAGLGVRVTTTEKKLGDHYVPASNTVCLSTEVAEQPSVAALAITAHELGHAQQRQEDSQLIRVREILVPAVRLAPTVSYVLILAGTVLGRLGLIWAGIAVLGITTVFMLLTLPVEFDASRRAFQLLERSQLVNEADRRGAKQMLTAAALTYVMASALSVTQLVRFILVRR